MWIMPRPERNGGKGRNLVALNAEVIMKSRDLT